MEMHMGNTLIVDNASLQLLKGISRSSLGSVPQELMRAYKDLESRYFTVLRNRVDAEERVSALMHTIANQHTIGQWEGLIIPNALRSPPSDSTLIPLPSFVRTVLTEFQVLDLVHILRPVAHAWHKETDTWNYVCATTPQIYQLDRRRQVEDMEQQAKQEEYVRNLAGVVVNPIIRPRIRFNNYRFPYGFMLFPEDPQGYCPQLELAVHAAEAVYCARETDADNPGRRLLYVIAKYLARTTLSSAGHVANSVHRMETIRGIGNPIPGEPGGKQWNNLPYFQGSVVREERVLRGSIRLTRQEAEDSPVREERVLRGSIRLTRQEAEDSPWAVKNAGGLIVVR